jgi:hypothetical protein
MDATATALGGGDALLRQQQTRGEEEAAAAVQDRTLELSRKLTALSRCVEKVKQPRRPMRNCRNSTDASELRRRAIAPVRPAPRDPCACDLHPKGNNSPVPPPLLLCAAATAAAMSTHHTQSFLLCIKRELPQEALHVFLRMREAGVETSLVICSAMLHVALGESRSDADAC